ncbi:MAG TPA: ATP synthase F0 subunit C [Candidatus Dependentiae bacterium]|nr:ATP synthase F0 subunit C [Candidatus Dependentiae bacterium]HRQ62722.1 ATP synthase F0 subunit C [Candidatus Dependentiae bacterium]
MYHPVSEFIHYSTIALTVGITSIGVGIGEGIASRAALDAMNTQPRASGNIMRAAILGMALIETAAIMGMVISIMLLLGTRTVASGFYADLAELGIAFAICISGMVLGFVSALPAREACFAIARQPFFAQHIMRFMLITQSLLQSPIIFGFIVATIIKYQSVNATTLSDSLRLISSGLCIGLGSVGPAIGLALFAQSACHGLGSNPRAYNKLFSFTLISQTIIETPIIFAFVISMALLFLVPTTNISDIYAIALLAAAISTSIGTVGPGISSGRTAASACHQIALNPESHSILSRISMFAQGLIETCAIYAVLISFLLIFSQ